MSIICPKCATENLGSFRFCQTCGTPLKSANEAHASSPALGRAEHLDEHNPGEVDLRGRLDAWLIGDADDSLELEFVGVDEALQDSGLGGGAPIVAAEDVELIAIQSGEPNPNETHRSTRTRPLRSVVVEPEVPFVEPIEEKEQTCARCGTKLEEGHRFCGKCGTPYEDKVEAREHALGGRRTVSRVSFVAESPTVGPRPASFALSHINDDGSFAEHIPLFEGDNVIGRASSNALNADRFVSPRHMRVSCKGDSVDIRDLQSLNGLFRRISSSSVTILDGTAFRIGEELLIFSRGPSQQALLQVDLGDDAVLMGGQESAGWGYVSLILGPYDEGDVYRLSKPSTTIGRTHGDIIFPRDGFVSGVHASLRDNGDSAILSDLESSNGTFLKFKALSELKEGVFLLLGNQLLSLRKL